MELRDLPSVDEVVSRLGVNLPAFPRDLIVSETRRVLEQVRAEIRAGKLAEPAGVEARVERALAELARPSLRRVINATGVVLHTNLGRAPLPAIPFAGGYSNLEYDLAAGRRGKRDVHVEGLLERLLGRPAIAVNNNAAAVFLALNELACGFEVIVSRGELIEIGDGFRIPDIMERSGAVLREVGTTNRTRIEDYSRAITDRTRLLLRVHPSNFRIQGFTERPALTELAALGKEKGIPVYEDLGSGCLVDLSACGVIEPLAGDSLRNGAGVVSFSGDKLLGGPQAGILAGDPALVSRLRRNPVYRALRLDKLILQALELTLRGLLMGNLDRIPALRMVRESAESVRARAQRLLDGLRGVKAELMPGESLLGGGSTPEQSIPTWLIAISAADVPALEAKLSNAGTRVVARIENDRLLLDLRTVLPGEEEELLAALQALS